MATRTFGWIQDPGSFDKLLRCVEIFDHDSATHADLIAKRLPDLVTESALYRRLSHALSQRPLRLAYADLVGHAPSGPRADAPCNGIVQATLAGQRRDYLSDWAADNFVRWAHALGFVDYDRADDTFGLTEAGRTYIDSSATSGPINDVLRQALLGYPPAVRVLRLLNDSPDKHLTKFEIGRQLGFTGEKGFTSLDQDMLMSELSLAESRGDSRLVNQMLSDWDGTSDKYARMIGQWLKAVGWVRQEPKAVTSNGETWRFRQAFKLTNAGLEALRRAEGRSRHPRVPKRVPFEMLATKAPSTDYLRSRRGAVLTALIIGEKSTSQLMQMLSSRGYDVSEQTVLNDVNGLIGIGLQIAADPRGNWVLGDVICGLDVPTFSIAETVPSEITIEKERIRVLTPHVPSEYLSLIDLSFDGTQSRMFEITCMSLLGHCGFRSVHLGGSDRPDGILYTEGLKADFGIIVDAKARGEGFNCGAGMRDQMKRYVDENRDRPASHPSHWWRAFPAHLRIPKDYRFLFITSRCIGGVREQVERLAESTGTDGAVISASSLLLLAEELLSGANSIERLRHPFASRVELHFGGPGGV